MPSPAQIKARKAFVKKYAGKKKGSKKKLYAPTGKGLAEYHADLEKPQRWKNMTKDEKSMEITKEIRILNRKPRLTKEETLRLKKAIEQYMRMHQNISKHGFSRP